MFRPNLVMAVVAQAEAPTFDEACKMILEDMDVKKLIEYEYCDKDGEPLKFETPDVEESVSAEDSVSADPKLNLFPKASPKASPKVRESIEDLFDNMS